MENLPNSIKKLIWYGRPDLEMDKGTIITTVLNLGTLVDYAWLIEQYGIVEVKKYISNPQKGKWDKKSLNFWARILEVEIDKSLELAAVKKLEL